MHTKLAETRKGPKIFSHAGVFLLTQKQLEMYRMFIVQAYQASQYVVPSGGVFLGKWRSSFAGNSGGKMNVQSACALDNRYI
jgi:hypothetical protein